MLDPALVLLPKTKLLVLSRPQPLQLTMTERVVAIAMSSVLQSGVLTRHLRHHQDVLHAPVTTTVTENGVVAIDRIDRVAITVGVAAAAAAPTDTATAVSLAV